MYSYILSMIPRHQSKQAKSTTKSETF